MSWYPVGQGCPLHPMLPCMCCDSLGDSQVKDLGEPIPFSLNPRHSYVVKDEGVKNRIYAKRLAKHALELEEETQEFQDPFYKNIKVPGSLPEDEDHSWTYHLPVHQRSHVLQTASTALCGSYDLFQCSVGKHLGMDAFTPWTHASDPYLGYPECTRETEPHMLHDESIRDREFPSLQGTNDKPLGSCYQCQCWLGMSLAYLAWLRKVPFGEDALSLLDGGDMEGYI
uniref:Uncharacterized protein n=1 Tax=Otus sunia TaxID=257818 RepID=A0A8C8AUH2_9STRI